MVIVILVWICWIIHLTLTFLNIFIFYYNTHRIGRLQWFISLFLFKWKWKLLNHVQLFVTPWTIQSMEFSRPESTFPSPGDLPSPGIKPRSPALQADCLPAEWPRKLNSWLSGFLKAGHKSVDVCIHLYINAYVYTFTTLCLQLILLPLLNLSSTPSFYFKYAICH